MRRKEFDRLIVWLRRDLRLEDNVALSEACAAADEVIPLFVIDNQILARPDTGPARVEFLLDALAALDNNLRKIDGRLVIRHGKAPDEVVRACYEMNAQGVYFQQEYEPYGRKRDDLAVAELNGAGKAARSFPGLTYAEPASILSQAGTPYTVYSPYKRVWFDTAQGAPLKAPSRIKVPDSVVGMALPTPNELRVCSGQNFECGGENAAGKLLQDFFEFKARDYSEARNVLAIDGTSKLSRHLHFGTISPKMIVNKLKGTRGAEAFLSEIAWRDFYMQILYHFPHVETGAFKRQFDAVSWENNPSYLEAWRKGETGYPIVDAAMRQLNQEAWMHNRARMIVASFLTKDLLTNWQIGEQYFMRQLVDGDLAANNGGWQWSAGTGTDAQPYFRVFNPIAQGEKFDPAGEYVRKYVPELKNLPNAVIHSPWKLSVLEQQACGCVLGKNYPEPIVDHKVQRQKAIGIYRSVSDRN